MIHWHGHCHLTLFSPSQQRAQQRKISAKGKVDSSRNLRVFSPFMMGMCLPCLNGSSDDYDEPSPETRRRQQAEAAEKRQKENDARGVKDPDALKRKQKRKEELERQEASRPGNADGALKWQVS